MKKEHIYTISGPRNVSRVPVETLLQQQVEVRLLEQALAKPSALRLVCLVVGIATLVAIPLLCLVLMR